MNNKNTIEKMRQLRLNGMADTHYNNLQTKKIENTTIDQYLALLVDQEWEYRLNNKVKNLVKAANFRNNASIRDIDYTHKRGLDRNAFERLETLGLIKNKENIIITGATGTGKSYLAQALGYHACQMLKKTILYNTAQMLDLAKLAEIEGNLHKLYRKINQAELLILDDFGFFSFDQSQRQVLMNIVDAKYDKTSIIITSQIPVSKWHDLIGEATIADAVMDRLVNSSHRIELKGESLRKNKLKNKP